MTETLVRTMRAADLKDIARLAEEGFRNVYPFDWLANAEALLAGCESGRVSVAVGEAAGEVVGYCNLRQWPAGGWIDQIVVTAAYRRRGIGRMLLDYIVKAAIERGFWKISLVVSEEDAVALSFYTGYGFEVVGNMRDEIRRGVDGVLLSYITDYELHP